MKSLAQVMSGRKGGESSATIINLLYSRPYNVNQIVNKLNMRYNCVNYHGQVLIEFEIVEKDSDRYDTLIFPKTE